VANTQSAKKQVRSSYRKWLRNRYVKGKMRGALLMVNKAITAGDAQEALSLMPGVASQLDKAAKKNVIHPKKAARLKSRLMHKINALQAQ
jgi:small subunit ribosomal protein S20